MAKKGRWATPQERLKVVQLLEDGKSVDEIVEILDVGRSTAYEWQARYRQGGRAALSTRFSSGRPAVLSDKQLAQLYSLLVGNDPRHYNLGFALWTRKLVAELIHQKFAIRMSLVTVGRVLKKLGMSPQRPLDRASQADPERVRIWKETTYPAIRAQAVRVGARVFFADEAVVRTTRPAAVTGPPGAAAGQTLVAAAAGERRSVNMISAISPAGDLHFQLFEGRMSAGMFIDYLTSLLNDFPGPIFLIVDGASAHTARRTKNFVAATEGRLSLYFLPPYSPQLNPDEWVWNNVKNTQIGHPGPLSQGHLRQLAEAALQHLEDLPHTVRGFFRVTGVAYRAT